jgi:hypothetical protein
MKSPDETRISCAARSVELLIENFPEVTEPECAKLRSQAILMLDKVRELLSGEPHH